MGALTKLTFHLTPQPYTSLQPIHHLINSRTEIDTYCNNKPTRRKYGGKMAIKKI